MEIELAIVVSCLTTLLIGTLVCLVRLVRSIGKMHDELFN